MCKEGLPLELVLGPAVCVVLAGRVHLGSVLVCELWVSFHALSTAIVNLTPIVLAHQAIHLAYLGEHPNQNL